MALNTAIRGQQIRDAFFGDGLKRNVADDNIAELDLKTNGGLSIDTAQLKLDINDLGAQAVDVSADSIAILDADDSETYKESIADLMTAVAGEGLLASSGALALNITEVSGGAVDVSADFFIFEDNDDNGTYKESFADLATAMAGEGLNASSGALVLHLTEVTAGAVAVNEDFLVFEDATDNSTKKESFADLATAMAGSGITATNGVLSVDSITDNIVEADIQVEDESANCNGVTVAFTLSSTPVTNSVQVFLNGLLQQEGSGKDYTLSGTTVTFTTAPDTGDILIIHYIINN